MKTSGSGVGVRAMVAAAATLLAMGASAAPLHFTLSFGARGGPNSGTLATTSLAEILNGNGEGLFAPQNLQYASFSGVGVLGQGSVTGVGPIQHDALDPYCVDWCRTISGNMFQAGQQSGTYTINWYFNNTLAPNGIEFPPGSGLTGLKNVYAHSTGPGDIDYPGFIAQYTPYSEFANLYNAEVAILDLQGHDVFKVLFRSSDCTEVGFSCSAFTVRNNFEVQFSNPVDGLFMHFEGPAASIPEPGSLALVAAAFASLALARRVAPVRAA